MLKALLKHEEEKVQSKIKILNSEIRYKTNRGVYTCAYTHTHNDVKQ